MSEVSSTAEAEPQVVESAAPPSPDLIIGTRQAMGHLHLMEVWKDRHVLRHMVRRDFAVRYKETSIGLLWAILQPLFLMLIFTLCFSSLQGEMQIGDTPYPLTVFAGLIVWQFVSFTIERSADCLIGNSEIISKVYFCRLVFPMTPLVVNLIDFGIRLATLFGLMAFYWIAPGWPILLLPVLVAIMALVTVSISLWLSALTAVYRDIKQAIPFSLQAWFFLSPVFYEATALVPAGWRWLYYLNPVAGLIAAFRWSLFQDGSLPWFELTISTVVSLVLFVSGVAYFRRVEQDVADIL